MDTYIFSTLVEMHSLRKCTVSVLSEQKKASGRSDFLSARGLTLRAP